MTEIVINFALLLGVTMGLTEVIKRIGLNEKFIPLVAVGIGMVLNIGYGISTGSTAYFADGLIGIVIGLSSVGLFSTVKNTAAGFRKPA